MDSENESGNKKKQFIAAVISTLLLALVIVVAMKTSQLIGKAKHDTHAQIRNSTKAVQAICEPTDYKETCVNSLTEASPNSTKPLDLIKLGFNVTIKSIEQGMKIAAEELKTRAERDKETKEALKMCEQLMNDAIDDLNKGLDRFDGFSMAEVEDFVEDLRVWLSGAVAYQQTCMDYFEDIKTGAAKEMKSIFKTSKELTSNGLAMVTEISGLFQEFNVTEINGDLRNSTRKLLSIDGDFVKWLQLESRKLLMAKTAGKVKANVVVAKDGSVQYKTINEALQAVPKNNRLPFVIYVKEGVYHEKVEVTKKMTHVTLIGDGPTRTRISGNLNFAIAKVKTYQTATVAVNGDHFMAKDIGFENTAGPEGHQAVALRVSADYAVFHNCHMDGYQDTLYAHSHRHFYRDCTISGTIDFIFGDAKAFFQNCKLVVRKPMNDQACIITAQGRTDKRESTGIILHNCLITGDPMYMPVKATNKAYLGRPWKEFSRTIILQTTIDNMIDPQGWLPWNGDFALNTLFYSEYQNRGPGSGQTHRVKWGGIHQLSEKQALWFTPGRFLRGNQWIPLTHVPYTANMY